MYMQSGKRYRNPRAEEMRLRALYRRAAMSGKLRGIPLGSLKTFTGPDCAYHLYSVAGTEGAGEKKQGNGKE